MTQRDTGSQSQLSSLTDNYRIGKSFTSNIFIISNIFDQLKYFQRNVSDKPNIRVGLQLHQHQQHYQQWWWRGFPDQQLHHHQLQLQQQQQQSWWRRWPITKLPGYLGGWRGRQVRELLNSLVGIQQYIR